MTKHYNSSGNLPPVNLPFIIVVELQVELRVIRNSYTSDASGSLEYKVIADGSILKGKYPWRYE